MITRGNARPIGNAWNTFVVAVIAVFSLTVIALVAAVALNSISTRWLGTWLPEGYTLSWYASAWKEFQLQDILTVTAEVALSVVLLSIGIGLPAAYALARKEFQGKKLVIPLLLLPLIIPPITYGIPLATVMYQFGIAGTLWGVIFANLIPSLPFVILVMTPFIEQIDPNLEAAGRVFGARSWQIFYHVLCPLLLPGLLSAGLLVLVRTIAMFELTFLTAGPDSQTLVVALYYAVFAAGVRAPQSIDAMAIIYMGLTLVWLLAALRFVNPTQLVSRVKSPHPSGKS